MKEHIEKKQQITHPSSTKTKQLRAIELVDNRPETIQLKKELSALSNSGEVAQLGGGRGKRHGGKKKKKQGKQQAGMPAKAKAGTKEKTQSIAQRAFNAFQSYRSAFFLQYGVSVKDVSQFLKEGNKLHGHASANSNSKENPATSGDADNFIGWYRRKHGIGK